MGSWVGLIAQLDRIPLKQEWFSDFTVDKCDDHSYLYHLSLWREECGESKNTYPRRRTEWFLLDGFLSQVTGTGHSNCAPKQNMFLLKIYIRACLVLLALLRLFLCCFGANIEWPVVATCGMWPANFAWKNWLSCDSPSQVSSGSSSRAAILWATISWEPFSTV